MLMAGCTENLGFEYRSISIRTGHRQGSKGPRHRNAGSVRRQSVGTTAINRLSRWVIAGVIASLDFSASAASYLTSRLAADRTTCPTMPTLATINPPHRL